MKMPTHAFGSARFTSHDHALVRSSLPAVFANAAAIALALALSGCGKQEESYTSGTFTAVYNQTIKGQNCIECHAPGGSAANLGVGLDFTSQATTYQTLLSETVSGAGSSGCATLRIVAPGSPSTSYLVPVLIASYATNGFGGRTGCQPINTHHSLVNMSADEQSSLIAWIQGGAPNN